ncbi:hypothetical protein HN51_023809, partial [Arachis hypogaea]
AYPLLKDRRKFTLMADPLLEGRYPIRGLHQAIAIAAMCLQEDAELRPLISDVVTALNVLARKNVEWSDNNNNSNNSVERMTLID